MFICREPKMISVEDQSIDYGFQALAYGTGSFTPDTLPYALHCTAAASGAAWHRTAPRCAAWRRDVPRRNGSGVNEPYEMYIRRLNGLCRHESLESTNHYQ